MVEALWITLREAFGLGTGITLALAWTARAPEHTMVQLIYDYFWVYAALACVSACVCAWRASAREDELETS